MNELEVTTHPIKNLHTQFINAKAVFNKHPNFLDAPPKLEEWNLFYREESE